MSEPVSGIWAVRAVCRIHFGSLNALLHFAVKN